MGERLLSREWPWLSWSVEEPAAAPSIKMAGLSGEPLLELPGDAALGPAADGGEAAAVDGGEAAAAGGSCGLVLRAAVRCTSSSSRTRNPFCVASGVLSVSMSWGGRERRRRGE